MKKIMIVAMAFVFAIASAFTTKAFNVTGWAKDSGGKDVSGSVDQNPCAINLTNNCTMTVAGHFYGTVYDAEADIDDPGSVLKHN